MPFDANIMLYTPTRRQCTRANTETHPPPAVYTKMGVLNCQVLRSLPYCLCPVCPPHFTVDRAGGDDLHSDALLHPRPRRRRHPSVESRRRGRGSSIASTCTRTRRVTHASLPDPRPPAPATLLPPSPHLDDHIEEGGALLALLGLRRGRDDRQVRQVRQVCSGLADRLLHPQCGCQ